MNVNQVFLLINALTAHRQNVAVGNPLKWSLSYNKERKTFLLILITIENIDT